MKLAIPINEKSLQADISDNFGRAIYFLIYDTDTKETVWLDNSAASSQGGAGIKAAQIIADSSADGLLAIQCGQNAANVLQKANIKIYAANKNTAEENIKLCTDGKLSSLENFHAGYHGANIK